MLPPSLMTVVLSRNWRIQASASINVLAFSIACCTGLAFLWLLKELNFSRTSDGEIESEAGLG